MLPDMLTDPLWWVASRLRRILNGLLVLALAVGAQGQAAMTAPSAGAPSGNVSLTTASVPASALAAVTSGAAPVATAAALAGRGAGPRREIESADQEALPGPVRFVGAEIPHTRVALHLQPTVTAPVRATLLLADSTRVRAASTRDERPEIAHFAPLGQRAPPGR